MEKRALLLIDNEYNKGIKFSIDHFEIPDNVTICTEKSEFEKIIDFSAYTGIGIFLYLKWFDGSKSIDSQVKHRMFNGFSMVKYLRQIIKYDGIISIAGDMQHGKDYFINNTSNGLFLIDRPYHPYFYINFKSKDTLRESFENFVNEIPKEHIRTHKTRLNTICEEHFSAIGIISIFFHDLYRKEMLIEDFSPNKITEEFNNLRTTLQNNDESFNKYVENFDSEITRFKKLINKVDFSPNENFIIESNKLKVKLTEIVNVNENQTASLNTNIGKILYIEDVEADQKTLEEIFQKFGQIPPEDILCVSSWEAAEALIKEHNISLYGKSTNPNDLVNSLINTVVVDITLLDKDGFKQRYQGLEIIDKLQQIGYFNIVVLTQSERFIKNEITHTGSKLMGWTKNDLKDETGQRLFVESILEKAFEVVFKTLLLKPSNAENFNSVEYGNEKNIKDKRRYQPIKEIFKDFMNSDLTNKINYAFFAEIGKLIEDNYTATLVESKKVIIPKNHLPTSANRIKELIDFFDVHIYNRLIYFGFVAIIIKYELDAFDSPNRIESIQELIKEKKGLFFGIEKSSTPIYFNLCITDGWQNKELYTKLLNLNSSISIDRDIEIGLGFFYWWEIFFIKKYIFEL